ncbi:hypothetical protein PR202_gb02607 [Eleusine coracana subsp. coracana]|uniref:Uncharacterized protein n=1 Tax=Eleusine coracana subsp. coracana TaxID=191504 RepID=A0AAV5DZG0_ELECO|nr:hypothetical protein PR202_gb02607 [Eleusine coracana subsp. coracana]
MDKNGQPSPVGARAGLILQVRIWGWPRLVSLADIEANHLSKGFITILFAVAVMSDNSVPVPPSEFGKHIGSLVDTMVGSDIAFTVHGETFHAHRAVVAARSPVFRVELFGSVSEGATSTITMHGMDPETFRIMLAFMYSDSLTEELPVTLVHSLFAAADRYALDRLKLICARKLFDEVTLDTVVTIMTCAELHSCPELKEKCLDFIAAEANDKFLFSEDFMQLGLNFPCILPDLCDRRLNSGRHQQPHHLHLSELGLEGRALDSAFYKFDVEYDQAKQIAIGAAMDCVAFSTGGHTWRVKLYPRGHDVSDNGTFMSIYLEHLSRSAIKGVHAFFEIIMIDENGQPPCVVRRSAVIRFDKQEEGWPQFISLSDLKRNHLTRGQFSFMCSITVVSDRSIRVPPSDLGKQLGMLLECTKGSDVSFVIAGETFHAHRAVLAARSPVFMAELLGSMAEATMPSITILDIAPAIFRIMLRFIYTDAVPGDDDLGDSPFQMLTYLLAASDRYALDRLKFWCAKRLWENVTVRSVSGLLVLVDRHSCLELKERCIDLMVSLELKERCIDLMMSKDTASASSLYLTDSFVQLVQYCPHLVAELQRRHRM